MSHMLALSDTAYRSLEEIAAREGRTPESVVESLIEAKVRADDSPSYETEDWFRHLVMTEDEIRESRELAERDDADA